MIVPSYQKVMTKLAALNLSTHNEIDVLLSEWRKHSGMGSRIVDNLRIDVRLEETYIEQILIELHNNRHLSFEDLESTIYKNLCYKFVLKGPQINMARLPDKMGGAKVADAFILGLGSRIKFGGSSKAEEIVSKLISDKEALTPAEEELDFCDFFSWATWSELSSHDPFDFVDSPDEILKVLTNLGLTHQQEGFTHLLLVYSKGVVKTLYMPTVADAGRYSYFKCGDGSDYCGRTLPWNPEDIQNRNLDPKKVKPRPEGVHEPIKLKHIDKPVRVVKGNKDKFFK